MIVAILAPGPSLAALTALPRLYDAVLAVNYALSHPLGRLVDWWVALDLWRPDPLPAHAPRRAMVTSWAAIAEGQSRYVPYPLVDFLTGHPLARPTATSMPAALWWAAGLGANLVDLFGCDQVGTLDFLGTEDSLRTDERWALERRECELVAAETGMVVRRPHV